MANDIMIWHLPAGPSGALAPVMLYPPPVNVDDASKRLPGGGYTTLRTYGRGRVLRMSDHFTRLEETARLAGHPLTLDETYVRSALAQALAAYPHTDARVRIVLDLEQTPGSLYFMLEPLHLPSEADIKTGVRVLAREMHRNNPKAKLTNFIDTASALRDTMPVGINEVLMVGEDGRVLEGLSSNFFAVKDGEVWTAEQGVLSGITRAFVINAIRQLGFPLRLEGLPVADLPTLQEAFITSASRGVLPVREIAGQSVGAGAPGPITARLAETYQQLVDAALENLE